MFKPLETERLDPAFSACHSPTAILYYTRTMSPRHRLNGPQPSQRIGASPSYLVHPTTVFAVRAIAVGRSYAAEFLSERTARPDAVSTHTAPRARHSAVRVSAGNPSTTYRTGDSVRAGDLRVVRATPGPVQPQSLLFDIADRFRA